MHFQSVDHLTLSKSSLCGSLVLQKQKTQLSCSSAGLLSTSKAVCED